MQYMLYMYMYKYSICYICMYIYKENILFKRMDMELLE